ncbi:MAG TPA: alpha/beta fold hydrolase [Acidimicrobiales bacterium]|nr:alpha/beta fold hydrolase [Acidimicrobiales bacterium]
MEERIRSDGLLLAAHLARPPGRPSGPVPAVVLCHGYPSASTAGSAPDAMPELADRIATEMGWAALAFAYRGCGRSEGQFSLQGWLDDVGAAVDHVEATVRPLGIWLAGFRAGGALAVCAAAPDPRVLGVASLGAPGDFDDWAGHPRRLLEHGREVGVITDPRFPPSVDAWSRELRVVRATACAAEYAPRPLLVVHGSEDEVVPSFDARILADAHGSAELRFITGAGHELRHDPRTVAVLLGWLDRQRHALRR